MNATYVLQNVRGEKFLVLDTTNIYPEDNPLHAGYMGRVMAESSSKEDGELIVSVLNKSKESA